MKLFFVFVLLFSVISCKQEKSASRDVQAKIQELQTQSELPISQNEIDSSKIKISVELLRHMEEGDFESAVNDFNEEVKLQLNSQVLEKTWNLLNTNPGKYSPVSDSITCKLIGDNYAVYQKCLFGNEVLFLKTVFLNNEDNNKIIGLFFQPNKN